jgi:non-heme chloroperoxidase
MIHALLLVLLTPTIAAPALPSYTDPSPHTSTMVPVDENVSLEVLDWGGTGRPIVLLAGMGNTAHVWDYFAPKLTSKNHVYAITRRGYGVSGAPQSGYSADRLGDDVLAVMKTLKIERPILVGHSLGGEELSSIGSRHPELVSALIYLDAGYPYAFYDSVHGNYAVDLAVLRRELDQLAMNPSDVNGMKEVAADLPRLTKSLQRAEAAKRSAATSNSCPPSSADFASFTALHRYLADRVGGDIPESELHQTHALTPDGTVGPTLAKPFVSSQIFSGYQRYTRIPVPILAIYASPHNYGLCKGDERKSVVDKIAELNNLQQIAAFQQGLPSARVVRIANANHYVFISNQTEVLNQIQGFIASLS